MKLFINSSDLNVTNPNNVTINLFNIIENKKFIELDSFACMNAFYNVNTNNNNITFTDGITTWTATLTPGIYNSSNILTAVSTAMNAASGIVFTVTLNSITQKVTISSATPFRLLFGSNVHQLNKVLGYIASDTTLSTTQTASNVINLGLLTYLILYIYEMGIEYNATSSNNLGTFVIPVNVVSLQNIFYTKEQNFCQRVNIQERSIRQLTIQFRDQDNNMLVFNGNNYQMILNIT